MNITNNLFKKCKGEGTSAPPASHAPAVNADELRILLNAWQVISQRVGANPTSVRALQTPEGGRIVVVGDTHGQLKDVLWIFSNFGEPSAENVYLFNGDVVGRNNVPICASPRRVLRRCLQ